MAIKRISNNRATKRNLSTDKISFTNKITQSLVPTIVQNDALTGLTNNTQTDIPNTSVTLSPGTYLLEVSGDLSVVASSAPSSASCSIRWNDSSNTPLDSTSLTVGMPLKDSTNMRNQYREVIYYTTDSLISIKARAIITVTGGSVSSRNVNNVIGVVTKLS